MSAPISDAEVKSARAITEEEWRALRQESLHGLPHELTGGEIPDVLLDYQKRLLASTAAYQVTVLEKSRRTGATWALGADAVLTSAASRQDGGMDTLYIGYNLDMAREFIDVCAMWAKAFVPIASEVGEFVFKDIDEKGQERDIQAFRIRLGSGFEIVALTSRPRSLRGRQGYVIIDEAAFHDDLEAILKAALAFLIWGGKVVVLSTHDGEDNPYNGLVQDVLGGRRPYNLVRFDFDDALKDGLYQRICLVTGQKWSIEAEAKWRSDIIGSYGEGADEELFCIPSKGSGTFLPGSLIRARMEPGIPVIRWEAPAGLVHKPENERKAIVEAWCEDHLKEHLDTLDKNLRHVFGEDFARVADLTVIWPLAIQRDMSFRTPFVVELRDVPFECQKQILFYIADRLPRLSGGAMDATGNGAYLAEVAQQEYGASLIEAIHFTTEWYRENTPKLKSAFEDAEIVIPKDDDHYTDLRAFKKINGVARIPSDQRTLEAASKTRKRHGDAAIAVLLAHYATSIDAGEFDYIAANSANDDDPEDEDDLIQQGIDPFRAEGILVMADRPQLVDPHGRPLSARLLETEIATPTVTGVRSTWSEPVASGMTPQRLGQILRAATEGDDIAYLTLAEEIEERDLHYRSVLGTRKRAVTGIEPVVTAASDDPKDVEIAEAVRENLVEVPEFSLMLDDLLDGIGKGYSVIEPIYEFGDVWKPVAYHWRDQRFFQFDKTGRDLRLREDGNADGVELKPYTFLKHIPKLKSGLPIRGGLAFAAAWAFIIKSYALKDWAAFLEVFGMPLRLGRYPSGAGPEEKRILLRAVRMLAIDAAAIVPAGMDIEMIEAKGGQGNAVFGAICKYLDEQISKLVLGQTMTTDDGSSLAQANVHENVRHDILRADARQTSVTINRDLVRPFVSFNFGPQQRYPHVDIPVTEAEDVKTLSEALAKLVPLGLEVEMAEVRDRLGFAEPEKGASVLTSPKRSTPVGSKPDKKDNAGDDKDGTEDATAREDICPSCGVAHARAENDPDELDDLIAEALGDWRSDMEGLLKPVRAAFEQATDYADLKERLTALEGEQDVGSFVATISELLMKARGLGDIGER